MVRRHLDGLNETILARELGKFSPHEPVNQPRNPPGFRRLDALHVRHDALPSRKGVKENGRKYMELLQIARRWHRSLVGPAAAAIGLRNLPRSDNSESPCS